MEQNEKITLWKERIQNCKNSGLSIVEWYKQNGFSKYAFYYWNKRVKLADQAETQKEETRFVELTPHLLKNAISENITPIPAALSSICVSYRDVRVTCSSEQEELIQLRKLVEKQRAALEQKNTELHQKDKLISQKEELISQKEEVIQNKDALLAKLNIQIENLTQALLHARKSCLVLLQR